MAPSSTRQQEMFSLIEAWESSTISQKEFCTEHNLPYHQFHYWLKKYRQVSAPESGFIALQPYSSAVPGITIRYPNGVELQLSSHPDLSTLKTLVQLIP